jgi:hypothetical protein
MPFHELVIHRSRLTELSDTTLGTVFGLIAVSIHGNAHTKHEHALTMRVSCETFQVDK